MTPTESAIWVGAVEQIGAPYIWGGKGDVIWSPKGAVPNTFSRRVFDCSGLITWAFKLAGLGDFRMVHSAQTLYNKLKELPGSSATYLEKAPALAFYGMRTDAVSHVALIFSLYGVGVTVEAAGGGSSTVAPTPGAQVKLHYPVRRDLIGVRQLPRATSDLT